MPVDIINRNELRLRALDARGAAGDCFGHCRRMAVTAVINDCYFAHDDSFRCELSVIYVRSKSRTSACLPLLKVI